MSAPTYTPQVLLDLNGRALASSEHRDAWLEARRTVVTATEAKVFLSGKTGEKHQIIREKVSGESSFTGNRYTENGNRREPHIIEWLGRLGFVGCGVLFHAPGHPRHAATPDALRVTFDEEVELAEIKTSKNDVAPWTEHFERAGYYLQMQWQMWCTGAARVLYVWEQHNDDWSGWPQRSPEPLGEPLTEWIDRDDATIGKLRQAADRWLVRLDDQLALAKVGVAPEVDFVLDALAVDVLAGRREEAAGKAKKDESWKRLLGALAERGELSQRSSSAQVTWTPPTITEVPRVVVDEDSARAECAAIWDAKVAADKAWAEVLAYPKFAREEIETVTTAGKLTVTAVKTKGEAE